MSERKRETRDTIHPDDLDGFEERIRRDAEASQADERARIVTVWIGLIAIGGALVALIGSLVLLFAGPDDFPNARVVTAGAAAAAAFAAGKLTADQVLRGVGR